MTQITVNCYYWYPQLNEFVKVVSASSITDKYGCYIPNDWLKRKVQVDRTVAENNFVPAPDFNPEVLPYSYDLFFDIKYLSDLIRNIKHGFPNFNQYEFEELARDCGDRYLLTLINRYTKS